MATKKASATDRAKSSPKKQVTTAAQWKQASQGVELELPSGNVCLVRPVGMQVFLERGMIPNSLMPIVREALKGEAVDIKMEDINAEQIQEMLDLFDAVTVHVVAQPKVSKVPRDEDGTPIPMDERDPEKLFADEVDFDDKQFIFQWVVGGTRDLERFREEQGAGVEHLRPGSDVEQATK